MSRASITRTRRLLALLAASLIAVTALMPLAVSPALAAPDDAEFLLEKRVAGGDLSPYSPGDTFAYAIDLTCNSNIADVCIGAELADELPAPLVFDPSVASPVVVDGAGSDIAITRGEHDFTVAFTEALGDGTGLEAGELITVTVYVQIPPDTSADFNGVPIANTAHATAENALAVDSTAVITIDVPEIIDSSIAKSVDDHVADGNAVPSLEGMPVDYTIGGGNTSNRTVDALVIQDPAEGAAGPLEGYLDFTGIQSITPPTGADRVMIEYRDAEGAWVIAYPTGPLPADPSTAIDVEPLSLVTGLRFTFSVEGGMLPVTQEGGDAAIVIGTETNASVLGIPENASVTVPNTASSWVELGAESSTVREQDAGVVISNTGPDVVVTKNYLDDRLLAGESTVAEIVATNGARPVVELVVQEPSPGMPDLADQGLSFDGFTSGIEWPAHATSAEVVYHYAGGPGAPLTTDEPDTIPAADPAEGVVGWTVTFRGPIEGNASAELPFGVTALPVDGQEDAVAHNEVTATVTDAIGKTGTDTGDDELARQPARVSTTVAKNIARDEIWAVAGSTTGVSIVGSVNDQGENASTVGSEYLVIQDPAVPGATPGAFWDTFDLARISTGVPANADLTVEYWDGSAWQPIEGAELIVGAASWNFTPDAGLKSDIQGIRFTYLPKEGELLPPGFTVAPNLTVETRSEFRTGGSVTAAAEAADPLVVDNLALTEVENANDTSPGDNTATDDDVIGLDPVPGGPGPDLIEKAWLDDQVYAFSDEERTTRISWATAGLPFDSVAITDDPTAGADFSNVAASVFDAFDLVEIQPITPSLDPLIAYDRVALVELYLEGSGWTDITADVCGAGGAACDGAFPGYRLQGDEPEDARAVRLTFEEGSHRDAPEAPVVGSGVAASYGFERGIDLTFRIRQEKRSDGGPVVGTLHSEDYNTGMAGVVDNTVGLVGDGPRPVAQSDVASIQILDSTVNISVSKVFDQDSLPIPPAGTPADDFPLATSTITATNETESHVATLTVTDPSPAQPAPTAYEHLDLHSIESISVPEGATTSVVTLTRPGGDTPYDIAAATALLPEDLADVTAFRVEHFDADRAAIVSGASTVIELTWQLRTERRSDGEPVTLADTVTNIAYGELDRPGGDPLLDHAGGSASDSFGFAEPTYGVIATKLIDPATRYEDQARTGYVLRLSGQPTGTVRTKGLTLTDETPTFWNAFDLASFPQVNLPTGVRQLRVAVLTGVEYDLVGGELVASCDGDAVLDDCWVVGEWQTAAPSGAVQPVLPDGVTEAEVRGVRFEVRRDGQASNWERPRNPVVGVNVNVTRRETLRYGPGGDADYPVPSTLPGLETAPGETVQGRTSNELLVEGTGAWGDPDSGVIWTADDDAPATTELRHRVNAISVTKAPGNGQDGAGSQGFPAGTRIPYVITFTNTGAWQITGLQLSDEIATDGEGSLLVPDPDATDVFDVTVTDSGGGPISNDGFAASLDEATGIVDITVPEGFVLRPGDRITMTAALVFRPGVAPGTPVVNTVGATSDRTFESCDFTENDRPEPQLSNVDDCVAYTTVHPTASAPIGVVKAVKGVAAGVPSAVAGDPNLDDLGVLSTRAGTTGEACATPNAGGGYFNNTCVPITRPGGTESWRVTFSNRGNVPAEAIAGIDVLPAPGDTGVTIGTQRGSQWSPTFLGNVTTSPTTGSLSGFYLTTVPNRACNAKDIEYSAREGGIPAGDACYADITSRDWIPFDASTPAEELAQARALKFVLAFPEGDGLQPGASTDLYFETRTAWYAPSAASGELPIAWNAIAAGSRGTFEGAELYRGPVEPVRAGIALPQGGIELQKLVEAPGDWAVELPEEYEFALSCVSGGEPVVLDGTAAPVTLPADGTVVTVGSGANIPLYAECSLSESPAQGAEVSFEPAGTSGSAAVAALNDFAGRTDIHHPYASEPVEKESIVATNRYADGGFTVAKEVDLSGAVDQDGTPIEIDAEFGFTVGCTFLGQEAVPEADRSFTLKGGDSKEFSGLPAGAECTVEETDAAGAADTTVVVEDAEGSSDPESSAIAEFVIQPGDHTATTVGYTNVYAVGEVAITKEIEGPGAARWGTGDFELRLVCTWDEASSNPVFDGTGTVSALAPVWTVDSLPAGSDCQVTEVDTAGATESAVAPSGEFTIGDAGSGPVLVTVTNEFRVGGLDVTKLVEGPGAPVFSDGPFVFAVVCAFDGDPRAFTGELVVEGDGSGGPLRSETIEGLPVGAECTVSEVDDGGADETPAPVTVTIPDVDVDGIATVVTAGFTNAFSAATLSLGKVLAGEAAGETWAVDTEYEVLVTCQIDDGTGALLTLHAGTVAIRGGETRPITDADGDPVLLPGGTRCFGEETETGGATLAELDFDSFENALVVTASDEVQELSLVATNTFEYGAIALTKLLAGDAADAFADAEFLLELSCVLDQGGSEPTVLIDREPVSIRGGERVEFDGLAAGAECWVVEVEDGGADRTEVSHGSAASAAVVGATGVVTLTVTNTFERGALGEDGTGIVTAGLDPVPLLVGAVVLLLLGGAAVLIVKRRRKGRATDDA